MKTVVKVYHGARDEYRAWRAALGELADVIQGELFAELIRREGRPLRAEPVENTSPQEWVWRGSGSTLFRFTLHIRYEPKPPTSSRGLSHAWRWLKWRVVRCRVRLVLIIAIEDGSRP